MLAVGGNMESVRDALARSIGRRWRGRQDRDRQDRGWQDRGWHYLVMRRQRIGSALHRSRDGAEAWLDAEREQLPLWAVVAFGSGIALWYRGGQGALYPLLFLAAAMACFGFSLDRRTRLGAAIMIGALCMGAGTLDISWQAAHADPGTLARPWYGPMTGRILSTEELPARQISRWTVHPMAPDGLPRTIRLNVPLDKLGDHPGRGSIVRVRTRLMPPAGPAVPGAYDFAARAWFDGLGATGQVLGPVTVHAAGRPEGRFARWRSALSRHVRSRMEGGAGALGATLATGDRGAISEDDAQAMRRSGMAHLLSISGLHVTAVVGAVYLLFSRLLALIGPLALRVPVPLVGAAAGAIAALGYTLLTGAQVPTIRACVAALLVLVAMALGRQPISLRMIAAGALIVLVAWPQALVGPSFQLSFAAVTAIVALHEWPVMKAFVARQDRGPVSRTLRFVAALFLTGLVVEIVLMPIAMFHFHQAGIYGPFANVIAIPLTTFVIMPLEALALLLDCAGLGAPVWYLCGKALGFLLAVAHFTASRPGSVAMVPSAAPVAFGVFVAGGLLLFLLKTRLRLAGIPLILAGFGAILTTATPDILVTGDGRHVAFSDGRGGILLLRSSAGEYIRSILGENAGAEREALGIVQARNARCSEDFCVVQIRRGGRLWTIAATRTPYLVPSMELAALCRRTDIVISDRRLPYTCRPRWLKADRRLLASTGGLAIDLSAPAVQTVAQRNGHLPWSTLGPEQRKPEQRRPKRLRQTSAADVVVTHTPAVPTPPDQ